MPYDWIDPHRGNIPQINREDSAMSDPEKAIAEERSRGLRVPGIVPGKLADEPDARRGAAAAVDPRGLVFDEKDGRLRSYTDDDFEPPKRSRARASDDDDDKPATERQQEQREQAARKPATAERK